MQLSFQRRILVVFIFTSISVSVIIFVIAGAFANSVVIFRNLLLSLYFLLSIWLLSERLSNYGMALILSVILLLFMGVLSSFAFFIIILFALLAIFLYKYKDFGSRSRDRRLCLDTVSIPVIAVILALVALSGTIRGYGDFWVDYKVLSASLHKDTFFHTAMSNMINHYRADSTGLHGLPHQGYHVFSHFLYGMVSNTLDIKTYQVYGHSTLIVFIPLLFLSAMSLAEELVPSKNNTSLYVSFLVLISIFVGFLGRANFSDYGLLWDSYFVSESYLVSLILLFAFLSYLLSKNRRGNILISSLFLFLLSACKISVGLMGFVILIANELFFLHKLNIRMLIKDRNLPFLLKETVKQLIHHEHEIARIATYTILFGYMYARFSPGGSEGNNFEFLYLAGSQYLSQHIVDRGRTIASVVYILVHYFFVWISMLILLTYYLLDKNEFESIKKLSLFLVLVTVVGFIPLSMPMFVTSCYYFSNISMFVAMPIILSLKRYVSKEAFITGSRRAAIIMVSIFALGISGSFYYGVPYLKDVVEALYNQIDVVSATTPATGYVRQLQEISTDASTKSFLVYIAKQETDFWDTDGLCERRPFVIPAVSERPALFGLPSNTCERAVYFGYEKYSKALFDEASLARINPERLCQETLKLGFDGYVDVTSSSYDSIRCQ